MTTLALAAVGGSGGKSGVALAADLLLAVEGSGQGGERRLDLDATETSTTEAKHQVEGGLFLNVVIGEGAAVFELLAGKDESLLIWGDALLVLDLSLDVFNGVAGLNIEGDSLSGEGLDEDLHATSEAEHQVEC